MRRRPLALALSLVALAAPASAVAQVGDEQSSDPLAAPQEQVEEVPGVAQDEPTLSSTPMSDEPAGTGTAGTGSDAGTAASSGGGDDAAPAAAQLPNTGTDPRVVAALGVALLLAGIGLRMRTADDVF